MTERELRRIERLITSLRDAVSAAGRSVLAAVSQQSKGTREVADKRGADPARIAVDVHLLYEDAERYYREAARGYKLQKWTLVATVTTFVAVVAYAVVTYGQYEEIKQQMGRIPRRV